MSIYEILPALDLTQSVHAKISIGMHRGVKFKISRIPLIGHRHLCRVKNMLAMYLKYHKAGLTPTTPVTSIAISPVKMSI